MSNKDRIQKMVALLLFLLFILPVPSHAWYDNTHFAIAKAAGFPQWYNAAGPDIAKIKAGNIENRNHYSNNPPGTVITQRDVIGPGSKVQ